MHGGGALQAARAHEAPRRPEAALAPRRRARSYSLLYGTLGQNKMRDVAAICAHKNKRTSPENFSLRNKAHRALLRSEKFLKKSFVFEAAQIAATSPYLSPPYKVLVSLPATQYRHYMVKPY